ncbi:hypothetical protein TRFO_03722 [Tritrichomonas foetus]|uniref:Microbial-type PARG catalytic domain-containing protein n=1 Tax=Tritrichomonas foetus TaxID=1144522 RepID=A0A1J4KQN3_9EUKA|nr:hypothetical protein TRFO_03722 [Tritrichomonas foetus]|eukprot:OHT12100.1 hypothetical protein TRFO_03722 [Tritrichomonas foetus]
MHFITILSHFFDLITKILDFFNPFSYSRKKKGHTGKSRVNLNDEIAKSDNFFARRKDSSSDSDFHDCINLTICETGEKTSKVKKTRDRFNKKQECNSHPVNSTKQTNYSSDKRSLSIRNPPRQSKYQGDIQPANQIRTSRHEDGIDYRRNNDCYSPPIYHDYYSPQNGYRFNNGWSFHPSYHYRTLIYPYTEEGRKKIAQETMKIIKEGGYTLQNGKYIDISSKIQDSKYHTRTYRPYHQFSHTNQPFMHYCTIEVTNESTFTAALRVKQTYGIRETCVLNFASANKPGGGFLNGRQAQEEDLARQSSLSSSLTYNTKMYDYHNRHLHDYYYADYLIYSTNVVIFRDDEEQLIDNPYRVSIISAVAVNKKKLIESGNIDDEKVNQTMENRCRKILELCISQNNKAIVLGAFGCGVFGNSPSDVAQIFHKLLFEEKYGKHFSYVVFAITSKGYTTDQNLKQFQRIFNKY